MLKFKKLYSILFFASLFSPAYAEEAIKAPGEYFSKNKKCLARITTSDMGGFLVLSITREKEFILNAKDITGFSWNMDEAIYSASPIYGEPGIYRFNCKCGDSPEKIVSPTTYNNFYPAGADYFELKSVTPLIVYYYYSEDVEKTNFLKFRTEANLRKHHLSKKLRGYQPYRGFLGTPSGKYKEYNPATGAAREI
jgi:hypothetical protein